MNNHWERVAVELWGKPLNVASNLAFPIAAGVIVAQQRHTARPEAASFRPGEGIAALRIRAADR